MSNFWRSPFITLCFVTLALLLSGVTHPVKAATFTVNSTSDIADDNPGDGACDVDSETPGNQCTLRAALQEANAFDGADIVNFAIPGTGVQTIAPETALPTITEAVTIDGYTQSGSRANTLDNGTDAVLSIELNGAEAPTTTDGLRFSASNCKVRGLVINGFGGNGIIDDGNVFSVAGCFIGTNAAGNAKVSNGGNGILIGSIYTASIGGSGADRNLISANGANGISAQDAISSTIQSNLIGTNASVTTDSSLGNGGSGITTSDGGTFLMTNNVISYNGGAGVSIAGDDNKVSGNSITSNGGNGIEVRGGSDNALRENNIYNNSRLGISLSGSSNVTPNDIHTMPSDPPTDSDSGPNNLQNFPDLVAANDVDNGVVRVFSSLLSTPNTTFAVDFYESATADPSGYGEGEKYIATQNVTTNSEGVSNFSIDLSNFPTGHFITATATEVTEGIVRSTSEFCSALRPTPSLSIGDATITEGDSGTTTANFTVTLSYPSTDTVTVEYATADGTAKQSTDYTARNGTLTFAPGQTTNTISVPVVGDKVYENDENFFVNIIYPTNATILDTQGQGTITNDDPPPSVSIDNVSVTEGNSGTTNAVFTVTLSAAAGLQIGLDYETQNGSATAPGDYTAGNGTLTFDPGQTTKTISVPVVGDVVDENDENFFVALGDSNIGSINKKGRCTIKDDDTSNISINDVTVIEGDGGADGTNSAVFTVTLSTPNAKPVTVSYTTRDGTAKAPDDYTTRTGTLTIAAGDTTGTITIPIVPNGDDGPDKTFTIRLSNPSSGVLADSSGTCTIQDDDVPPRITINDVTVTEGNSGTQTANFTVTLSVLSGYTVTVDYATANGGATAPADYTARTGTLTFAPGEKTKTIAVPVVGDTLDETDENFFVNLSKPTKAVLLDAQGQGTIRDDDASPTLSINDVTITEGNSGTSNAVFTITLSAVSAKAITVAYATQDSTAKAPDDYTARGGTLTIPAGATTGTITVPVKGDLIDETDETFFVNLTNPTNATLKDSQGKGTIRDDDTTSLSIDDVTVTEGSSGTTNALFTVTLSTPSAQAVSVAYTTQDGTAKAPADYTARSGILTIAAGATTGTITVPVIGDRLDEPNETFTVRLSNPRGGIISNGSGTGTIQDDDALPSLSINDVSVTEGNSDTTNAVFTITLSSPSANTVTVVYATQNGSATTPADYASRTGTLIFTPGQTTQTIAIPIRGDTIDEKDETFFVNLTNPTNATLKDAQGQGTIKDDDTVSLSINDVTVTEGNRDTTNAVFTVTLSAPPANPVSVNYATQDGTAKAPSDYTARSGTLTIAAESTTGTITVPVVGDMLDEPNETFTVRLSNPVNATLSNAVGSCTIRDDDVLALDLTIMPNVVAEGATATATITRSGSTKATALTVTLSGGNSRVALPSSVVIPAGAASTTFNVGVVDNQIADGDLNLTIMASATGFTPSNATFQVHDNETAKLTLSVSPNAFAENAGKDAAVGTVTRDTPSNTALTVSLSSSDTSAATVPASVTIAAGATIATFSIAAVDDAVVDGEQSTVITASATGLLSATATVKVADDDSTGPPPNDNFNRAQSISGVQGTVTGRTLDATHEEGEPNHADGDGSHSVWYVWTAPAMGPVTFDTEGSAFDTVLAIYTGTAVNDLTLINDDDDGGSGATSRVSFRAVAGQRYFIAVDGFRDEQGTLVLRWNLTIGSPTNDDIARAQVIFGNGGQVSGDNRGATKESGEPNHAGEDGGTSVWYQWTAPASGTATFDTRGSVFDTLLGVYAAKTNPPQANALTPIASNDDTSIFTVADGGDNIDGDDNDDLTSRVSFEAVAGRTYFIAVDGFQGDQGPLILHWNLTVSSGSPIRWYKKDANGQGQSGNWNNPNNWLPHRVPQSGDFVSIKLPGTYSVMLDVDANVSGIELGGSSGAATLAITDKSLVLRGRSTVARTGIVQLSDVSLSLASDGIVYGAIEWSGGQLRGGGTLHTLQGAQIRITGDKAKVLALNAVVNDGVATWEGSGPLLLSTNARFVNNGQFTSRVASIVRNQGGGEAPIFFNYGTYTSMAVGTSQFTGVEFWNAGRGNIQAGVFRLNGGGASYGVFDIASGARLEFSSDFFFAKDASRIIGGGQAEQLGGTFVVNTDDGEPVEARNFELSAGELNGANSQSQLEINEFRWTGGSISGKGQITLKDNFYISGQGSRPLTGQTLTSQGNAEWNGSGPLTIGDGAVINIQGNLYARDGFTVNTSPGKAPVLNNSGAIKPGDAAPDTNVRTNALTPLSTGILNIFCNYNQAASGILNLDVRGTKPGSDYDQVNVRGDLTIAPGAKIEVNLPAGVTPQVGDKYRVVTFTERRGEFLLDFSKVVGLPANLSLLPVYSANALDLVVVSKIVTEAPFISGRVRDGQGNGLASVTVKRVSADNQVVTTTTDSNGYYAFSKVPPGRYLVSPVASSWVFGVANVTVSTTQNAPNTDFAGTRLNSNTFSKAGVASKIPSAPSS